METFPPSIKGKCLLDLVLHWPSLEILELSPYPTSRTGEPSSLSVDFLPQILDVCPQLTTLDANFSLPSSNEGPIYSPGVRVSSRRLKSLDLGSSFSSIGDVWPTLLASFLAIYVSGDTPIKFERKAIPRRQEEAGEEYNERVEEHGRNVDLFFKIYTGIRTYRLAIDQS